MEEIEKADHEVAQILERIEMLRSSPLLSLEEKIVIARRLVSVIEEDQKERGEP